MNVYYYLTHRYSDCNGRSPALVKKPTYFKTRGCPSMCLEICMTWPDVEVDDIAETCIEILL